MQWGKQIVPQAFKNIKDVKSGGSFLNNLGIDKNFVGQSFNKYSEHLSKIGLNKDIAAPLVNGLTAQMETPTTQQPTRPPITSDTKLDRSKYHKI